MENGKTIQINWLTGAEINCNRFELLKSEDGINFRTIKLTNNCGETIYTSYDYNPTDGINYYKVVEYDLNEKIATTSTIISVLLYFNIFSYILVNKLEIFILYYYFILIYTNILIF